MADTIEAPQVGAHLTRERAAEYIQAKGLEMVTATTLAKLAGAGRGPAYTRFGKHVVYRPGDLDEWIRAEIKPAVRGRKDARGA